MAAVTSATVFSASPITVNTDETDRVIVLTPDEHTVNYIYGDLKYDGNVDSADALAIL